MINLTRQTKALRNILAALLLVLPALAQAQLTVSVQSTQTPEGYSVVDGGTQYVLMSEGAALQFSFSVNAPGIEVTGASGTATFNGQSYTLQPNLNGGSLTIDPVQVPLNSVFNGQTLRGNITYNYRYTNNESDTDEHTATASVSSTPISSVQYPSVEFSSITSQYLLPGSTATVTYNITGGRFWRFSGPDNFDITREGNIVVVQYTATEADAGETSYFAFHASGNEAGDGWIIGGNVNVPVTVYPAPEVTFTSTDLATYIPGELQASIYTQGGNSDGWRYQWTRSDNGGADVAAGSDFSVTVSSATMDKFTRSLLSCRVANVDPTGRELFSQNVSYRFTFYETPSITISSDASIVDMVSGAPYTFTSTILGGAPEGWSYRWLVNGSQIATTQNTTYTPQTSRTEGSENVNVQFSAQNTADNIVNPFSGEQTRTYRLWGQPQLMSTTEHEFVVFSGTSVYYGANYIGGVDGGWTYTLGTDNQLDQPNNTEIFTNTGTGEQVFTRTITATNEANGQTVYSDTQTYTIHVWPVPTATWAQPMPTDIISGSMASTTFGVNTAGGDPSAWSYYWTVGGGQIGTGATAQYDFTNDGTTYSDQVLAVTVTNTPAGIDAARNVPLSHTFRVWPAPAFVERSPESTTVYSGTEVTMSAAFNGGVESGWTYTWSCEGAVLGNDASYTFTTENTGAGMQTKVYTLTAVNMCNGAEAFRHTYDYTVNTWPVPSTEWAAEYATDVINGYELTMNTANTGGDPEAWSYAWTLDGTSAGTAASYVYKAVNTQDNGSVQATVALHAVNTPENIDAERGFDLSHTYTVWPTPALAERSQQASVVFSGTPVTMSASFNGGVAEGWTYSWSHNGAEVGTEGSLSVTPENNSTTQRTDRYTLTAVNVCSGIEVFRQQYDYDITVWPLTAMEWGGAYPTNVINGDAVTMAPKVSGGNPASWSYDWQMGGSTVGTEATYVYNAVNTQDNGSLEAKVDLRAVNAPENIDTPRSLTLSHTFNVWPTPAFVERSAESTTVFSGTAVTMNATFKGGVADGWTYTWTSGGQTVGNEAQLVITPETTGTAMTTATYRLTAVNICEGKEVFRETYDYTVNTWPLTAMEWGGAYPTNVINGEAVTMAPKVSGGNPVSWSYDWQMGGSTVGTEATYVYNAANTQDNGSVEAIVSLRAVNAPENIDAPRSHNLSHTFTVWPTPAFVERSAESTTVYSGTSVTMSAAFKGGVAEGWTYTWTLDGQTVGNEAQLTVAPENTGTAMTTAIYRLTAVNVCEGQVVFNQSYDYTVNIWPTASANWAVEYPTNVINGIAVEMGTAVSGGDPAAWSYTWALDGNQSVATGSHYTFMPVNTQDNGSLTQQVGVTAVNTPVNIDAPFSRQLSHTFTVWPTPALVERSAESVTVFAGTDVNLSAVFKGGVEGAWAYAWSSEGETLARGTDYGFVAENTSEGLKTTVYTLTAANVCESAEVFRQNYEYVVNVWPGGTVGIASGMRANMVNGESQTFAATVTGGDPEAWSYRWTVNGEDAGTASTYDFTAVNGAETGTVEYDIVLTATNHPAGIDQELVQTAGFKVTAWPTASASNQMSLPVIFSGENVTLTPAVKGGYTPGWTYEWRNESGEVIGTELNCTVSPTYEVENSVAREKYFLQATNTTDGYESYNERIEFEVAVFSTPHIKFQEDYPSDVISGESFTMVANTGGGDNNAWSYEWKNGDNVVSTASSYTFTPANSNAEGAVDAVISLHAVNAPVDIITPAEFDLSHTFHVWPQPRVDATSPEVMQLCSGEPATLSVTVGGGYTPGWTYKWECNGEVVGTEASLPISHTNDSREIESHVYTCLVLNELNGIVTLERLVTVNVEVYPQPLVEVTGLADTDLLEGESRGMFVDFSGGDPEAWTVTWSVDGVEQSTSDSYKFTAPADAPADGRQSVVSVTVANNPASAAAQPFSRTFSATYTSWPTPRLTESTPAKPIFVGGETIDIGVTTTGGLPTGWTYLWTRDGTAFDCTTAHYSAQTEGPAEGSITTHYTVIASNSLSDNSFAVDFDVTVYAAPVSQPGEQDIIAYRGREVPLQVSCAGGNPDGWSFEWSTGGSNGSTIFNVPETGTDGETYTVTVHVTNTGDGRLWDDRTFTYRITAYSLGSATLEGYTEHDYCGSAAFTLNAVIEGGYPDGWRYRWTIDGVEESTSRTLDVAEYNTGDTRRDVRIRAYVTNSLPNGDTGFTGEYMPDITIWPQMVEPTGIYISNTAIRQGNSFYVELQPMPEGGYENSWTYDWRANGAALANNSYRYQSTAGIAAAGSAMATEEVNYSVAVANLKPEWFSQRFTAPTMTVYRRPLTPASLQRKGNGNTHTLIVMMGGPSDAELTELAYQYVFGYTDAQGDDHFFPATDKRYLQIDRSVFDDGRNALWVMTQWTYPDGSKVTSGRRYLDGSVDEDYDASQYADGGRGESTIGLVEAGDGILSDGRYFICQPSAPTTANVKIYTASGMLIRNIEYPRQASFCETIDVDALEAGMYVVKITVGDLHKTSKVVVDYK